MRPSEVLVDTSVIINLACQRLLDKLCKLFRTVHVPRSVRREARFEGRQRKRRDVVRFKKRSETCTRWDPLVFATVQNRLLRENARKAHRGESEMIAQAIYGGLGAPPSSPAHRPKISVG